MGLPAHPGAAWAVVRKRGLKPISFGDYLAGLHRIPKTVWTEAVTDDPYQMTINIDRDNRIDELRARWLISEKR